MVTVTTDVPVRARHTPWVRQLVTSPALYIGLLAWVVCLPSALRAVQLSPDMVEYVDVARRLVNGEGYLLGIKAYHLGGPAVIHDGLIHRTPLFTLLMAGMLAVGLDLYAVQVLNAAFGAFSAVMVYAIGTQVFGRTVGIWSGILVAASPIGLAQQVQIQSDALATALTLTGLRLLLHAAQHETLRPALFAGLVFGLGYLTRPPVAVIPVALALALPFVAPNAGLARRLVAGLLAGLALVIVPVSLASLAMLGRLSYSGKGYLYGVVSDADVMENGYAAAPLTPVEFITRDPGYVLGLIWTVFSLYARSVFLEREWLLPLIGGWPGAILALVRGRYPWTAWLLLVAAATNFVFYGLTWSSWQDRFMLTTVFLLLPFVVDGLLRTYRWIMALVAAGRARPTVIERTTQVLLGLTVVAVVVLWSPRFREQYSGQFRYGDRPTGVRTTDGFAWTGPPRWVNDGNLDDVIDWARTQTSPTTVLAHGQPWPYAFFTRRPMVLLPYKLTDEQLRRFLIEYRVSYVLYDTRDPQRREYGDQLKDLEDNGVRSQRLRNLVVYDTRALWQP
jgi:hypothetical protein